MTAPRTALVPRDVLDLSGKQPHSIDVICEGKVWRVGYERENHFLARWDTRQQLKLLGLDLSREETQWRIMQVVLTTMFMDGWMGEYIEALTHQPQKLFTKICRRDIQCIYT